MVMTSAEIGALIGLFGLAVAVLTFAAGRQGAVKRESAGIESMRKDIEYIKRDINELKEMMKAEMKRQSDYKKSIYNRLDAESAKNAEAIGRLRVDERAVGAGIRGN